ncbi:MAG: Smr/MutS family protein [Lewinellaceae bacterium]|nr:Smr/MutS family protein [Phaeodactylibacter sp.]MCB9041795.1 Smr/MutS family protein [Lewinellaceae bacterium]
MLFAVGTKVRFLHSRDEGVVTGLLDNDMVNVLLDDGNFEIPAFIDDLVRAEEFQDAHPSVKAKIVPGKQKNKEERPDRPPVETQYTILKSFGIQLAFDPVADAYGHTEKYRIILINDTRDNAIIGMELYLGGRVSLRYNGKLDQVSTQKVGELLFDQLNDSPLFEVDCWRITTQGTGSKMHKTLRLKPKHFFNKVKTAPLLNKRVHLFRLFESLKSKIEPKEEGLDAYTRRNLRPASQWLDIRERMPHEVVELAEFIPELDLHIERLVSNSKKLSKGEILAIQLSHFESYIQKAIRLGVERVFIIHGVGKGRLRDAIASQLLQMPEVSTFRNEFHPRYGYGATEVVF